MSAKEPHNYNSAKEPHVRAKESCMSALTSPMYLQKEPSLSICTKVQCFCQTDLHVYKRARCIRERGLSIRKRALCTCKTRPMYLQKKPYLSAQESNASAKQTYMSTKEPHVSAKEAYLSAREPHVLAKESYMSARKSYMSSKTSIVMCEVRAHSGHCNTLQHAATRCNTRTSTQRRS